MITPERHASISMLAATSTEHTWGIKMRNQAIIELLGENTRLGRELAKEQELRKMERDRLTGEVSDLRRQVADLEELLRREEARS